MLSALYRSFPRFSHRFRICVSILRSRKPFEAREWFNKEVLGGSYPWTPAIKAKLIRQLKRRVEKENGQQYLLQLSRNYMDPLGMAR